jgi:hypothetical protein
VSTQIATQYDTYMVTMTPGEWSEVPDNPRQRDTEARLCKAKHLDVLEPSHTLVHMAEWDGGRCKLEGHTRALKWLLCPEIAPEAIDVRVYVVDGVEDAKRLYGHFNSKEEGERANDRLFGAMRENGIEPTSEFVRKAKFSNAVSMSHTFYVDHGRSKFVTVYDKVRFFRDQIVWLDEIAGSSKRWIGPVVACFLMSSKKHGRVVADFFAKHALDAGIKDGRRKDCIQLFSDTMTEIRSGGFCDWATNEKAISKGLWCVERWLKAPTAMCTLARELDAWKYRDEVVIKKKNDPENGSADLL